MVKSIALPTGVTLQYAEQGKRVGRAGDLPARRHRLVALVRACCSIACRATIRALAITQRGHGDSSKPDDGYRYARHGRGRARVHGRARAAGGGRSSATRWAAWWRSALPPTTRTASPGCADGRVPHASTRHAGHAGVLGLGLVDADGSDRPAARPRVPGEHAGARVPPEFLETVVGESLKVPARVWREAFKGFLETAGLLTRAARARRRRRSSPGAIATPTRRARIRTRCRRPSRGSRLVMYPGAGHAFHWEDPDRVRRRSRRVHLRALCNAATVQHGRARVAKATSRSFPNQGPTRRV